jgi:hypothetical protein
MQIAWGYKLDMYHPLETETKKRKSNLVEQTRMGISPGGSRCRYEGDSTVVFTLNAANANV